MMKATHQYLQTPSKSQFTENNKVTTVSGTQVDSHTALEAVTSWIQSTPGLPQHDHAMMFTRYSSFSMIEIINWKIEWKRSIILLTRSTKVFYFIFPLIFDRKKLVYIPLVISLKPYSILCLGARGVQNNTTYQPFTIIIPSSILRQLNGI